MSVVYYTTDGDDILIATMAARAKAKAVQRVGEASICVLDEKWPLTYLQLYGPAHLDTDFDLVVDTMVRVGEIMSGQPLPQEARPFVEELARREDRVVIRLSPEWTVYSPPCTSMPATTVARCSMVSGSGSRGGCDRLGRGSSRSRARWGCS